MNLRPGDGSPRTTRWLALLGAAAVLGAAGPARADLIVSVQTATAAPGTTGNALEVILTNTGMSATPAIGGFSFGISTANPGVVFTQATTATTPSPYIFAGQSLFGPNITVSPGTSLTAADLYAVIGSGVPLGSGETVGLGHVLFDVLAGTADGVIAVTLTPYPTTSLSDASGPMPGDIPITTLSPGSLTVTGSSGGLTVPEPATVLLVALAWPAGVWWARRRRAAAPQ